jgi:zinc/manganese transport system permease protein
MSVLTAFRDMWALPFLVNAFRAGTIVAVLAAAVGWFMVLRRQSFAGHTLSVVGFPGAAGAVLLGLPVAAGYFGLATGAALLIGLASGRGTPRRGGVGDQAAVVGTVQAFCLAAGFLFVALYHGFLSGTGALLFGSFLGITSGQVVLLGVVAVAVLGVLAVLGRPLLFASVDPDVAAAAGVPVRALGLAFLVLLGLTAAAVGQITGSLLVFALLVLPPATARLVTARPLRGLLLAAGLGVAVSWAALVAAYWSPYPVGFWLTTAAFATYLLVAAGRAALLRLGGRRAVRPARVGPPSALEGGAAVGRVA